MAGNTVEAGMSTPRDPRPSTGPKATAMDTAKRDTAPGKASPSSRSHELDGLRQLGRYTILKKLGQGGMGTVFLAQDTQLRRQVALKILPREKAQNPTLVKRFKSEAQAAAQLKHDNIVAVHDAGEADGLLYIALEFIDGTDAYSVVAKRGPMPVKRSLDVIRQTTLALQHAYEQKIVHRDIKPSNLLIRKDGMVKLADMGLARSVDESLETNITRAGTTVGTVDYMSPEQARNSKAADIRSDLYSLGATWFHLLTGHPPFPEGSMLNKLNAHSSGPRPDVRDENDSVPESIAVIIKRLMAVNPEDRYQTPLELLEDLDNENLTRGPTSLRDLASLAEGIDDQPDNAEAAPKAPYRRPAKHEAKQLAAAATVVEMPVHPSTPVAQSEGVNTEALKKFGMAAALILGVAAIGYILSEYSGAIGPGTETVSNPFDRSVDTTGTTSISVGDTPASPQKRPGPRPLDSSDSNSTGESGDGQSSSSSSRSTAGPLYLPPMRPLGREGEVRFVPEWISESGSSATRTLKTIAVGGGPSGLEEVPTLEQALLSLPSSGGIIELLTNGPYFLNPVHLKDCATVVIRAASGTTPLVVLVPEPHQPYDALLQVSHGALTLEGLHLQVHARQFANDDPLTLVSVRFGDLAVIRCTLTLVGTRSGDTFAFGSEGLPQRTGSTKLPQARVLVRDSIVQGNALGVFHVDQTQVDVVASQSVFVTGRAPVLSLTSHELPTSTAGDNPDHHEASTTVADAGAKKSSGPKSLGPVKSTATNSTAAARRVRLLSCTALCSDIAFEISPGADVANPPTTEVTVVNSTLAGVGQPAATPVLLAIPGWKPALLPADHHSLYPNLTWQIEGSALCAWSKLILDEPGAISVVRDGAAWKNVWRNQPGLDVTQFQSGQWPKSVPDDLAALSVNELGLPTEFGLKGTDGQAPGCPIRDFATVAPLTLARASALVDRASYRIPGLETFAVNRRIELNANETTDIGRDLNAMNWPSGTLVVVRGQGNATMTPIEVKNKALRIEFQHTGDSPLVMGPQKSTTRKNDEAMFIVENGSLEVIDGYFRFPNTASAPMPAYFLSAHDSDFLLRRCQITGQMLDGNSNYQGLIRWKRSSVEPGDLESPAERNVGLIIDSSLLTTGKLLDADLRNRTLLLRNSLFASVGDLFDLSVQGFDRRISGVLDARWCTFGAGGSFLFQVRGTKVAEQTTQPLSVFMEHSVLLSLAELSGTSASPVLLSIRDESLQRGQIAWWDFGNGYSSPWTQFVHSADTPPMGPQSFDQKWRALWGHEQVVNPLIDNGGVRLAGKLPHRAQLSAKDFRLANNSPAATWGPNQTPLGVDFDRWSAKLSTPSQVTAPRPSKGSSGKSAPQVTTPRPSPKPSRSAPPTF